MKLTSQLDNSVNFLTQTEKGLFESRYVNRDNGYFICYLSSHTGCNQGCKMCHLTATGQVKMKPASLADYKYQAEKVFEHAQFKEEKIVNINFMARGEPLLNPHVLSGQVFEELDKLCRDYEFVPTYNISTIFPLQFNISSIQYFGSHSPTLYYSYYSDNPYFREEWLPNAHYPIFAFDFLSSYFRKTGIKSKIHFALIKNENDCEQDFYDLAYFINRLPYSPQINIVRYNSPNDSEESDKIEYFRDFILDKTKASVYVVPRVGFDVKASCGMFVS